MRKYQLFSWVAFFYCLVVGQTLTAQDRAAAIISACKAVFTEPPIHIPSTVAVDAPLLGNGYSAAALGGKPDSLCFYLARNDFWRLQSGFNESFPAVLGKLQLSIPALKHASYRVEQSLYNATMSGKFIDGDTRLLLTTYLSATEDLLVIQLHNEGPATVEGTADLLLPQRDQFNINPPLENKFADTTAAGGQHAAVQWITRGFTHDVSINTMAAAACKMIGGTGNHFRLQQGQSATIVCALSSSFKEKDYLQQTIHKVARLTPQRLSAAYKAHTAWWSKFWHESYVDTGDSLLNKQYYLSHYIMASCSRDVHFPASIFGSWITREIPAWNGDYHLNYNYMAPYYALYSSNHLEQAAPYESPLIDFMERGKYYSRKVTGIADGVLYPVGIGPMGIESTRKNQLMEAYAHHFIESGNVEDEGLFFGQKTDAAYALVNMAPAFYYTYRKAYAQKVYPYVKAVAQFWAQYPRWENGRYVIENDAIHEGTIGDRNPILSLGLARLALQTAIDVSRFLQTDSTYRIRWDSVLTHLAPYPTQMRNDRKVFRYTETGTAWWGDNSLGIQHIFPAGQIGPGSDTDLLQTARNTIGAMQRWMDNNGSNSFFPAAVRVGYPADSIWYFLRKYSLHTYPNGFQLNNPHGIENCSTVPATINEMMCMSYQDVLRLFSVWPSHQDAAFWNLRARGAFLVSSRLANNEVSFVSVKSEQGRRLMLENPWPGQQVVVKSSRGTVRTMKGTRLIMSTQKDEILYFEKASSYQPVSGNHNGQ
ncbi:glycosyl hydrolase family 95 catalytic domain-containing protein [Chitinophaga sp. Ak27]|uniref:glycosyl hydrolase family 95 catalytic domain-containing protein n=1 Tax=Chitinophaga sp. Ak27 TaxID=2726116 RepID=UPI00145CDFAF|nr:hypothetical protein [Chitinophaga sp. Ak27]NLU96179.1 hypothetical protein [Chitinophaga sp. Ak27]